MTGLDALKTEMLSRGCSKAQIESKTVGIVLDIIANSGTLYQDLQAAEKRLTEINILAEKAKNAATFARANLSREMVEFEETKKRYQEYIENFNESLKNCETDAARDALRTAQAFINAVDINTKYDNTAFIVGLSGILSRNAINPVMELQKINPKAINEKMIVGRY